jgi:hypothetical protein
VLEAMACDLPVVTTRFGFLRQSFTDGPGVTFADSDEGLLAAVSRLRETRAQLTPGQVRAQVQPFSWDAIARTLLAHAGDGRRAGPGRASAASELPRPQGGSAIGVRTFAPTNTPATAPNAQRLTPHASAECGTAESRP